MALDCIAPGADLRRPRGSCLICIIVKRAAADVVGCLQAVVTHTPADVPLLVCDCTPEGSPVLDCLRELEGQDDTGHQLLYLRVEHDCERVALKLAMPADIVLLSSECVVAQGWFEGLRGAAQSDSRVASASPMFHRCARDFESAAAAVQARSLRLRPRVPMPGGPCVLIRRSALELAGPLESASTPSREEDGNFWDRCTRTGLSHVLADDVLVLADHRPADSDVGGDWTGPLGRALNCARRARLGLSVAIDAGILSGPTTGTQVQILETIGALARTGEVRIRTIVPDDLSDDVARSLQALPDVELLTHAQARQLEGGSVDIVHRPYQINDPGELTFLSALAERLVVTQQDLISYFNPWYFSSVDSWKRHRELTRGVLAIADRVLFFSDHARREALGEELVEPHRASVAHIGVDHRVSPGHQPSRRPAGAERLDADGEVILCIGTDYLHKNRIFALRVLEQLQRCYDWRGWLVLAGSSVSHGSSRAQETELLAQSPRLRSATITLSAVSESEKTWLYQRAGLVIYPTVHEGFGLIPFEAADHDTPCMWAPGTSLSELLTDDAATIVPWDAELSAQRANELLRDHELRADNLEAIRAAGARLTWDATAARLLEVYSAVCDEPGTPASASERRQGRIGAALSEDSMRLVGPGGALPEDVERPLLALATHPRIGAPLFRALKLGYQTSYRLRRWGKSNGSSDNPENRQRSQT